MYPVNDRSLFSSEWTRINDRIRWFKLKAIMISGRTLAQGAGCECKMSPDFFKAVSVCSLSTEDYKNLGLSDEKNAIVKNEHGSAVFSVRVDAGLPPGIIFIPMGPWANVLVGPDTGGCGTPQFKGVEVEVLATDRAVQDVRKLFRDMVRAEA
jgi:formylmethanofuran dehydrogenase subunit D